MEGRGGGTARSRWSRPSAWHSPRPRSRTPLGATHSATSSRTSPARRSCCDPSLVNAWGLAFGPTTPAWVADNGTDVSTLYSGAVGNTPVSKLGPDGLDPGRGADRHGFQRLGRVRCPLRRELGPGLFLFSSEAGKITGWNQNVPPPAPSTQAQTAVNVPGAIFKGLAIANTASGPQIYATDFHNDKVDVWDANFAR